MKKNKTVVTVLLLIMTFVLLGAIFYISTLLSSDNSPTQIQKTKASAVTYSRTVDLPEFGSDADPETTITQSIEPTLTVEPTSNPALIPTTPPILLPSKSPTLLAQAPTLAPTQIPTKTPTIPLPTQTNIPEPTEPPTPTLSPLLAYKSTGGITPTLIPIEETGGMVNPTKSPVPTKKIAPTGVQKLPDTGWIQTSSILFIVAASTIFISLLF